MEWLRTTVGVADEDDAAVDIPIEESRSIRGINRRVLEDADVKGWTTPLQEL